MLNPFDNPFQDPAEKPKKYLFGKNKKTDGLSPIKLSKDAKKAMEGVLFDYEGIKLNKECFRFIQELEKQVLRDQQNLPEEDQLDKQRVKDILKKRLSKEDAVSEKGEIIKLDVNGLSLSELSELPDALQLLECYDNNLENLPEFPETLRVLFCGGNNLKTLPELPEALQRLWCWNNNLEILPELPEVLRELYCRDNNLEILPKLPEALQDLECLKNPLTAQTIKEIKKHKNASKFQIPKFKK